MENRLLNSYEQLVERLTSLEKVIEKSRTNKIPRILDGQKLKKKLQRRYQLFET